MRIKKNKVALITGGTGGFGTAICKRLYEDGYTIVANYRNFTKALKWRQNAKAWQENQMQHGVDVKIVQGDISNYLSSARMFKQIEDEVGPIDVLVNNAGISRDSLLRNMTPEQWYEVINTNLNSVYICSRFVIENMLQKKWGRIVNISSVIGHKGGAGLTNYATAKAGLYGFTKALASEVITKGITVNTVSPGYCSTPLLSSVPDNIMQKILAQIPMGRLGKPEEIAGAVSYLASDDAAYVTGADISINGGMYMY